MSHVVIRCDATPEGGIGHLVRAISVADAARDAGWSVTVAGSVRSALADRLLQDARLEAVPSAENLEVLAAQQGATVVHVDDYTVGADAHEQVRASGALLSSMEDGVFGRRPADVVIDSTIRAEQSGRPEDGSGRTLLGIRYAPMRRAVREAREAYRASAPPDGAAQVLIVAGGTDPMGAAGTLASVCTAAEGVGRVRVISPEGNWDAVRAEAGEGIELLPPSPAFLEHVAAADLVISAAGTTAWELACIGVPSLLVAVVENQHAGYEAAIAEGIARGLGTIEQVREDRAAAIQSVSAAVADLRAGRAWTAQGRADVDGLGAERIVQAWQDALADRLDPGAHGMTARRAGPADSSLLLRWRNDPATRAVSRQSAPVAWEDHTAWFRRVLEDPARELLVVHQDGVPVGTVRFDALKEPEWEVSITLAPEARGRGLSLPVLEAGQDAFAAHRPGARIIAAILPDNAPSQRLFARAGYVLDPHRRDGEFDVLIRRDPS